MRANVIHSNKGALKAIIERAKKMAKGVAVVGVQDGLMHTSDGRSISMSYLANIHEFGAPSRNIVARPFLFPAMEKNQGKYAKFLTNKTVALLRNKTQIHVVMQDLGHMAAVDVQDYIKTGRFTPLYWSTIKRKGHEKPLLESYQLYNAITYKIERA